MKPIFVGITRSFWLSVAGIAALFGAGEPVLCGLAAMVAPFVPLEQQALCDWLLNIAPAVLWVAALHQRSGASRAYSLRMNMDTLS